VTQANNRPKFYLTTPIYYANARPHVGSAYTTLVADTHFISDADLSRRGIAGMDQERRGAGSLLLPGNVGEDRVQEVVARGGDQGESIFATQIRLSL